MVGDPLDRHPKEEVAYLHLVGEVDPLEVVVAFDPKEDRQSQHLRHRIEHIGFWYRLACFQA